MKRKIDEMDPMVVETHAQWVAALGYDGYLAHIPSSCHVTGIALTDDTERSGQ